VLTPLTVLVVVAASLQGLWAAWFAVRDRAVILKQLWGAAVVEALLLVQTVVAAVLLATGDHPGVPVGELWGYLVTVLLILPFAAAWAFALAAASAASASARSRARSAAATASSEGTAGPSGETLMRASLAPTLPHGTAFPFQLFGEHRGDHERDPGP